jgi:hypothetical protein
VSIVWGLLVLNVLTPGQGTLLPIPHRVSQVIAQGSLYVALVLAVSINPRLRMRPNWFLGLYTVLALISLMTSVRLVGLGTEYRIFRMIVFLVVLWLLTPWWGRRDLPILRSHVNVLFLLLGSVVLGYCLSPGKAMVQGRLIGTIWPIWATGVAHYAAELAGVAVLLWLCSLISHRHCLVLVVPCVMILLLTHTRTALSALLVGLVVGGTSLLLAKRRARMTFAAILFVVVGIGVPAAPFLMHWAARGQDSHQLESVSGRRNAWSAVLAEKRPAFNTIFGSGLSNDGVANSPRLDGTAIDSSYFAIYQDQGIVGEMLIGAIFVLLLLLAFSRARGPTRALALFLIIYCLIAGINETGLGQPSPYVLDLAVAASLVTLPSATGTGLTFGPMRSKDAESRDQLFGRTTS